MKKRRILYNSDKTITLTYTLNIKLKNIIYYVVYCIFYASILIVYEFLKKSQNYFFIFFVDFIHFCRV